MKNIQEKRWKIPGNDLFRYLYQTSEQHRYQKRWATDFVWSKNKYRIDRIVEESDNQPLSCLHGPDRAFEHEELMHIPEDNQVPAECVIKWKWSIIIFMTKISFYDSLLQAIRNYKMFMLIRRDILGTKL